MFITKKTMDNKKVNRRMGFFESLIWASGVFIIIFCIVYYYACGGAICTGPAEFGGLFEMVFAAFFAFLAALLVFALILLR